jgi:hypothetical protein
LNANLSIVAGLSCGAIGGTAAALITLLHSGNQTPAEIYLKTLANLFATFTTSFLSCSFTAIIAQNFNLIDNQSDALHKNQFNVSDILSKVRQPSLPHFNTDCSELNQLDIPADNLD